MRNKMENNQIPPLPSKLELSLGLEKVQRVESTLEQRAEEELRKLWDKRIRSRFAFIPHELIGKITAKEAIKANEEIGKFASSFLKETLNEIRNNESLAQQPERETKKIVAIGYGRGYDSKWLKEATEAGLQVHWIDVSEVAHDWASKNMDDQRRKLIEKNVYVRDFPKVECADIKNVLEDPNFYNFDMDSVKVWYLCRMLNCLSEDSAKIVLQKIGSSLVYGGDINSRVIIVNAFKDENPDRIGETSQLYSKEMILSSLQAGIDSEAVTDGGYLFEIVRKNSCMYFDQKYDALEIAVRKS